MTFCLSWVLPTLSPVYFQSLKFGVAALGSKDDLVLITATQSICHDWFSTRRLLVTEKTPDTPLA